MFCRSLPDMMLVGQGLDILAKVALNEGMSSYVFVVLYRHDASALVVMILALLEPVIGQNLYILGIRATTATFTVSMSNVLPAITFVIAWILRLEVVNLKSIRSQAKVAGTLTTVAGAMIMALVKGPLLELFWTKERTNKKEEMHNGVDLQHSLKGAIMIVIGCFGWSCFVILQAITLKSYPDELAMTAWICLLAIIEGAIAALIMERGNPAVWAIICSGAVYYVQGSIMRERGPVFVTAFNPLCMITVAVMGSIFLAKKIPRKKGSRSSCHSCGALYGRLG